MEQLLQIITAAPLSATSLGVLLVMAIFQLADRGLLNIKIGKFGEFRTQKGIEKENRQIENDTKDIVGYIKDDKYQIQIDGINQRVNTIDKNIDDIKNNHLFHIEGDMVIVKEGLAYIKGKLSQ